MVYGNKYGEKNEKREENLCIKNEKHASCQLCGN